jgi:hypothetical protein
MRKAKQNQRDLEQFLRNHSLILFPAVALLCKMGTSIIQAKAKSRESAVLLKLVC